MARKKAALIAALLFALSSAVAAQEDLEVNRSYRVGQIATPAPQAAVSSLDTVLVVMPGVQGNSCGFGNSCGALF